MFDASREKCNCLLLYSRRAGENMMRTAIISEKKQPVQNITKQHTTSHSCFLFYQARIHFFHMQIFLTQVQRHAPIYRFSLLHPP